MLILSPRLTHHHASPYHCTLWAQLYYLGSSLSYLDHVLRYVFLVLSLYDTISRSGCLIWARGGLPGRLHCTSLKLKLTPSPAEQRQQRGSTQVRHTLRCPVGRALRALQALALDIAAPLCAPPHRAYCLRSPSC